ncbi:MAG TPA: hypothetical protein VE091_06340 [Gemmatimonadales bacterium]|nr:hypothetical protein [Gemmatimonadales bacterium]
MPRVSATLVLAVTGCAQFTPPAPATPREATPVAASFGRTWDAVIDEFADRNIPIRTIERASGLIATEQLTISYNASTEADCGQVGGYPSRAPTHAVYNVLVRGDSTRSTVKVTMRWMYIAPKTSIECSTRYKWEKAFEETARLRAQRTSAAASQLSGATQVSSKPAVTETSSPDTARATPPVEPIPRHHESPASGTASARFSCAGIARGQLPEQQDEIRRLYVGDLRRAGLVECVEQLPPDLVRVMVGPGFDSLPPETREAKLSRLYGMYGSWGRVYLELWTETGKFAEYVDGEYRSLQTPRTPGQRDRAP